MAFIFDSWVPSWGDLFGGNDDPSKYPEFKPIDTTTVILGVVVLAIVAYVVVQVVDRKV